MSLETVVNSLQGTDEQVLSLVRARVVKSYGVLAGAKLQGLMIAAGLMPLVHDTAQNAAEEDVIFRGICIGLLSRFNPDGEVNFADQDNRDLLDAFLSNSGVADILALGVGVNAFRESVLSASESETLEFPSVNMIDVIRIRRPADVVESVSNTVAMTPETGLKFDYFLALDRGLPEKTTPIIEIRHSNGQFWSNWIEHRIAGFSSIQAIGAYRFSVPGSLLSNRCEIRVKIPYTAEIELS